MRGTNCGILSSLVPLPGSSPHTRDKFQDALDMGQATGIIPAYAGQMCYGTGTDGLKRDHPRIRGTNSRQTVPVHSP